ncbi:hypothetical protein CK203_074324 [Vitis vinifera]|uniref:Reverse transcriptase domain-containing protein n=1 Tax=Vitis vinifera TaxID=29760 RepID=A0A438BYP2_VITVI|nr:hypothetical protein CK203_074324 [Vitis vinifera]
MEEELGMGFQMERGIRVNPLSRCPLSGNLSKEDTSASRVEVKGGLTGRVGFDPRGYSVMGSPSNSIIRGKELIFEAFCEIPGAKNLESSMENQGISKFFYEKGGVDYLNHGDIPDRVEEENQCALSNHMTESCTPKNSIVRSHKEVSGDFLIDGLSPEKMAKVREENLEIGGVGFKETDGKVISSLRRLQYVKAKLEEWNKFSFGELKEKKKSILNDLTNFDAIEQEGGLNPDLRNRKYIKELENERGLVLKNAESITEEILHYFEKLYTNPTGESWGVEGLDWSPISEESALRLDSPFTEEEISKAIFQLDRDKVPGPDGFTIAVF